MSKANQHDTYVKVCVLCNGVEDINDVALQKREVKEIFANHRHLNFDIEHSHNYLSGVDIVENYLSKTDETIQDTTIPSGSWLMTLNITNPTILGGIMNGDITGVSLETDFTEDMVARNNNTVIPYRDVVTKEELIPHVVSFTGSPANQLPLEVMTHKQYTRKSRKYNNNNNNDGEKSMVNNDDEVSFWRRLFTDSHTSKSIGAVAQPNTTDFDTNELIKALIENQKIMPDVVSLMETVASSNASMSESFKEMTLKFDEFLVSQNTIKEDTSAGEPVDTSTKASNNNKKESDEEETSKPVDATNDNKDDTKNADDSNFDKTTDEDTNNTGLTSEEEEQLKKLQAKQKQHTSKSVTGKPVSYTNAPRRENNQYMDFIAHRSYDDLINN